LTNGAWQFDVVDNATDAGWETAMTATIDRRPVVAYTVGFPSGLLKIAVFNGASWDLTQIDSGAYGPGIAVDLDGYFHIVYPKNDPTNYNQWDLWYATNAPAGDWTKLLLDPGSNSQDDTGGFPSIAVDAHNNLHVTYCDFTAGSLMYARKFGGDDWQFAVADSIGGGLYSSLALDDAGGVHVSYENGETLRYAYCADCAK
jgi:hypothetical protein